MLSLMIPPMVRPERRLFRQERDAGSCGLSSKKIQIDLRVSQYMTLAIKSRASTYPYYSTATYTPIDTSSKAPQYPLLSHGQNALIIPLQLIRSKVKYRIDRKQGRFLKPLQ